MEPTFSISPGNAKIYRGFIVTEINADAGFVSFGNGVTLHTGQSQGGHSDAILRVQIEETIAEHFRKELALHPRPAGERIKVLSLFFIDRVAHYTAADGKIRQWFTEAYGKIAARAEFAPLATRPVASVHNGYYACDSDGAAKDSKEGRSTKADDDAYRLIMQEKERLLSPDEPLRFIFSHSALREGWDNPNVFQICTLREGASEIRKRQEIGRGLRLARLENGARCDDPKINRLTVIANESFADFARKLQTEFEDECGVSFEGRIADKRKRHTARLNKAVWLDPEFAALWDRIKHRTRYRVEFDTSEIVKKSAELLRQKPGIAEPHITVTRAEADISRSGVAESPRAARTIALGAYRPPMPDVLGYLQRETELTRTTLAEVLIRSERTADALRNPQEFMEHAAAAIQTAKQELMVSGIKYERIAGQSYEMMRFESEEIEGYLSRMVQVSRSIYDVVEYDSEVERKFAEELDARTDIRLFVKLPGWFRVKTPLGDYNPDWAIVKEDGGKVYLVRETKHTRDLDELHRDEKLKILCGKAHFTGCLGQDFDVVTKASEI